jgi:dipeptidase E
MAKQLLLVSNSTLHGSGYLDHCIEEIKQILHNKKHIVFIPYARPGGISHEGYTKIARERLEKIGKKVTGIHEYDTPKQGIDKADGMFIGGGNTFVLLHGLYESGIINQIRSKVEQGMPYIGTSAGSNVACINIKTTNDMPIMYPPSFDALKLVPFNINPHYLDPDPNSTHMGETRETRIKEFHIYNEEYVIGLREGAMLHLKNNTITLKGKTGAKIFSKKDGTAEYKPGDNLDFLLK